MTAEAGLRASPRRRRLTSAPLHSAGVAVALAGLGMVVSAGVDVAGGGHEALGLAGPGVVLTLLGLGVRSATTAPRRLPARSVFSAVFASWVAVCLAGGVPYLTTGAIDRFDDALFESVAGFTTTAASVIPDVGSLSDGLLFWRALTQWLGGLGVIVLAVAVLPHLGVGGMSLLRSELPPASEYLAMRVAETARRLWLLYAGFTIAMGLAYLVFGMGLLDAVAHAFTTVSAGGFSTRTGGFAAFDSAALEWAAAVGMLAAGMNVVLVWWAVRGRTGPLLRSAEARAYALIVVLASTAIVAWNVGDAELTQDVIRRSAFSVVSVVSTTGFAVSDFGRWVPPAQTVLLLLMFVGAMSASAGGGSKVLRLLAVVSHARRETSRHLHRRLVGVVRIGHEAVPEDVVSRILGYYAIFLMAVVAGTIAVASFDVDIVTALSSVASSIANVGPALGALSPGGSYLDVDAGARGVHMFLMLLGRVEIYPVLLGLAALGDAVRSPRPGRLMTRRASSARA